MSHELHRSEQLALNKLAVSLQIEVSDLIRRIEEATKKEHLLTFGDYEPYTWIDNGYIKLIRVANIARKQNVFVCEGFEELEGLYMQDIKVDRIYIEDCPKLGEFRSETSIFRELWFEDTDQSFETIEIWDNPKLENLNVHWATNLRRLSIANELDGASDHLQEALWLNDESKLKDLEFVGYPIQYLDVSELSKLKRLTISNTSINKLRVENARLKELYVTENLHLTHLSAEDCPKLEKLDCSENPNLGHLYFNVKVQKKLRRIVTADTSLKFLAMNPEGVFY